MFWVTFLVKWNGAYYTKNAFKILISKCRGFSACAPWFTKDQEGHTIYWASCNKVFSTIQYMTICCLCHANIIMPSAIWLELSNSRVALSQVTKISLNTRPSLYTYVRIWGQHYSQMCYAVRGLCIWTVSSEALLHICLQSNWLPSSLCLPCSSLSQEPLWPQFPWYVLIWSTDYSVCQIA